MSLRLGATEHHPDEARRRLGDLRFTVIGHAGLYVERDGTDLLVDPWLFGSCYWRSWWHYPPIDQVEPQWLTPRFVYLSHHHFDHFHYPSLRRISREAHVLVPRFGVDVMQEELARLGFPHVTELPHGVPMDIGGGLEVRAYQYGVDDTALVVSDGTVTIADLNDCKIRGDALRQMRRDVGPVTFMLKNYSAAQAYPGCYRAAEEQGLRMISRESYLVDFFETARELCPRYAVPFASMTCFLHPETLARNADVIVPADLGRAYVADPVPGCDLVVMDPGASWSQSGGFRHLEHDPYQDRDQKLRTMAEAVRPEVEAALAEEAGRAGTLTFERFAEYFSAFVGSLPPLTNRLFRRPVVFAAPASAPSADTCPYWVVDVRHRSVSAEQELPADWASLVHVPAGVLVDAMDKQIVNFVHISMRLRIDLAAGGTGTDFLFWGALTVYELGYLPLRHTDAARLAAVCWARRHEFAGMVRAQLQGGSMTDRLAGTLMPRADGEGGGAPQ